ncbi:MAG: winged helix-turn-helix domain-containing protein, partial [Myxococcota bacterium]|nr:winged helix-turn-helix domain-containing protein [Myxococcota bacterium]
MSERVRQIRERLAGVLPVLSDAVRADIEALFALAERVEPAAREAPKTITAAAADVRQPIALPELLRRILASAAEPLRVRDLTQAAAAQGWCTSSSDPAKVVSACLGSRDEFVAVARGLYVLRGSPAGQVGVLDAAPASTDAGASIATEPAAAMSDRSEPAGTPGVVLAVLRERATPMRIGEVVDAALARGWTTRSDDPAKLIGVVLRSRSEFVSVGRGLYALREAVSTADPDEDGERTEPEAAVRRGARAGTLRALIHDLLARHGAPMRVGELLEALVAEGWTTTSASPRDVVAAVLSSAPGFVAVGRGVYA